MDNADSDRLLIEIAKLRGELSILNRAVDISSLNRREQVALALLAGIAPAVPGPRNLISALPALFEVADAFFKQARFAPEDVRTEEPPSPLVKS